MSATALLLGAAERPRVNLVTALPLVWGEDDVREIVGGRSMRAPILTTIDAHYDVRPIDVVTDATIADGILMIAQPRRLAPAELVAIDRFVRAGGRALIFADPDLRWQSRYPLGDVRRAPPVTLLDPLLGHWGLILGDSDRTFRPLAAPDGDAQTNAAGRWTVPKTCSLADDRVADCRIGKGHAILVADADVLDDRGNTSVGVANRQWALRLVDSLGAKSAQPPTRVIGLLVAAVLSVAAWLWQSNRVRRPRT